MLLPQLNLLKLRRLSKRKKEEEKEDEKNEDEETAMHRKLVMAVSMDGMINGLSPHVAVMTQSFCPPPMPHTH